MAEPFLGEIRLMSFAHAPKGWTLCNGQLLPINQNQALFSLLGITYGGNGLTTFALPDLRGRVPIHFGGPTGPRPLGERLGAEAHTLTEAELPMHIHGATAGAAAGASTPAGNVPATPAVAFGDAYADPNNLAALAPQAVTNIGGSQPHDNMQPFLTLNFCIALIGIFPSLN